MKNLRPCFQTLCVFFVLLGCVVAVFAQHPSGQATYRSIPVEKGIKGQDPDLEKIRAEVIQDLADGPVNDMEAERILKTIRNDGTWPGINYEDVSRTGFEHSIHLEHIYHLARAYRKAGSGYYKHQPVLQAITAALGYWFAHDFICDNWWWNEMGTPHLMINILLVSDDALPEALRREGLRVAGRANMEASGARPGGDLIQIAAMRGKQALYQRNPAELRQVVSIMASEIRTTTGRGMKPDLGFHHRVDNVTSILSYGTGYANSFAYWAVKTAGTRYALPEKAMNLLVDYFLDGICASMAFGRYPDPGAENRGISRKNALAPSGPDLARNLWLASSYRRDELAEIVKSRKGEKAVIPSRSRFFWHSEYYTHQRPGYFASVRMHSSRNHNMEQPHNEEGLKNHHYADGSNFLTQTGKEYYGIFPAWDWHKVPGTTVVQKPELPHWRNIARKGKADFTGGVTDGLYGAAAFDLVSVHDPLRARKSWFFFDEEYVCLGSGISSEADYPVATTLDQRLLNGGVTVRTSAASGQVQPKGDRLLKDVRAVSHDNVSYIFLQPQSLRLSNTTATGSWYQINHQSWATEEPVQKEVFTLWIDHGLKPANGSYAYLVVPGSGSEAVDRYLSNPPIRILSNTADLQAVVHESLGIYQAVFYTPGRLVLPGGGYLAAEQPCMVMARVKGEELVKLIVSDPNRKLSQLHLKSSWKLPAGASVNTHATWTAQGTATLFRIDLPKEEMAGQSIVVAF